jgi:hypothetical protein
VPPRARRSVALRLFLTVWLVYAAHFSSNVVRETYLAISLGDRLSVRVDPYLGLHPDLFEIEGRGAYINSNPGASMLAALPYALSRPLIAAVLSTRPELARPKPPATYDDPRSNRTRFMNEARARGLDVRLALAALAVHQGLMMPLAGLATVLMFGFLRRRLRDERTALWLALLFAFGTPVFFRSAFLNQNEIVAYCALFAFLLLADRRGEDAADGAGWREYDEAWPATNGDRVVRGGPPHYQGAGREQDATTSSAPHSGSLVPGSWCLTPGIRSLLPLVGAGALLGLAILCDYSGVPLAAAFGLWIAVVGWRASGVRRALLQVTALIAGALPFIALLLAYQWAAFGHPLWPAQHYMPPTPYSVRGAAGFTAPTAELLVRNLFDPAYGLFAFCPMLLAALAAPLLRRRPGGPSARELWLLFGATAALYLFSSANQFASLQWNTGVRYLVPAAPLLFLALVPVLLRLPVAWRAALIVPTVAISWCVAMARESVPLSLLRVFVGGFELPFLTVLQKTASAYAPFAATGVSPLPIFALLGVVLWLLWRDPEARMQPPTPS